MPTAWSADGSGGEDEGPTGVSDLRPSNRDVAGIVERVAELLELEEANPFRVRSYRRAAGELRALERPVAAMYEEGGRPRLREIPGVGERLGGSIAEIVETGRLGLPGRLESEAWLPVMEVERDGWQMRPLFSNTRRAHELGRARDWVVVYWDRDGDHGQSTVVTARSGPLEGERVVRGREAECRERYRGSGD